MLIIREKEKDAKENKKKWNLRRTHHPRLEKGMTGRKLQGIKQERFRRGKPNKRKRRNSK
jgi:hypothetical protein